TLLAPKGTNTWLVAALAATECAVAGGWGGRSGAATAGTLNVGTSCSSVLVDASITPRIAAPWAVRGGPPAAVPRGGAPGGVGRGAAVAVPSGGRAGVMARGTSGLPEAAV